MSPLARSPVLSALARTKIQRQTIRQFRNYSAAKTTAKSAPADWSFQWRRVGGSFMMYVPVVTVVMFWPYAVAPVMDWVEERS